MVRPNGLFRRLTGLRQAGKKPQARMAPVWVRAVDKTRQGKARGESCVFALEWLGGSGIRAVLAIRRRRQRWRR